MAALDLWAARNEMLQLLIEKSREAERFREEEGAAAVTIQRHWRGHVVRSSLKILHQAAITIQCSYRMYRGQLRAEKVRAMRDRKSREEYFHKAAVEIQRHFRGYMSRQYVHNYYARARYIKKVLQRTEELRNASEDLANSISRQQQKKEEEEQRQQYESKLASLHHLLSTKSMPGVLDGISGDNVYGTLEQKMKALNLGNRTLKKTSLIS